jgi:dihydroxy-acid dehydratase
MELLVGTDELEQRRRKADSDPEGWKPRRERKVSQALKAYASMVSSADQGAIRVLKED